MRRSGVSIFLLLVAGLVVQGLVSTNASAGTYTVPTSIDRLGISDVSAKLTAFIAGVPDGSTITFPSGSRYRIESTVVVTNRNNLTIDGAGAQFVAYTDGSHAPPAGPNDVKLHWPRHRDQWLIVGGSKVTVRHLNVKGANPYAGISDAAWNVSLEGQAGVEFYATKGAKLENCAVSDTYGDFVYIGHQATDTRVTGCTMTRSGRQGISAVDAERVVIDHNNLSYVRMSAITLETYVPNWNVSDVWVVSNTFGRTRLVPFSAAAHGDVSRVVIAQNTFVGQPFAVQETPPATLWPRRHDWYIIGNKSNQRFGSPNAPLYITNTDHVVIKDNTQPLTAGRHPTQIALNLSGSTRIEMSGNSFPYV